jgi:cytochrome c oxidase subunit IV
MSDSTTAIDQHATSHGEVSHGHGHDGHGHHDGEFAHPAPLSMLFTVFFALLGLTVLTVWQSTLDIGEAELWVTLFIATVKAGLVILFFMHLLWDKPLNAIVFLGSIIFVALFLGFTLMDAHAYNSQVEIRDTLKESMPPITTAEKAPQT